jgi:6-phosphogluconolactonase
MIHIFDDLIQLFDSLAEFVITQSNIAIQKNGRFSFVLSGGSSPRRLYELMASEKYRHQMAWDKVDFFFGDERYVPALDPQSNYLMAKQTLFDPLNISSDQIYAIDTTLPPDEAARSYQNDIRTYFKTRPVSFDLILLGLGDNVHTASLFPHSSVLHEKTDWVKAVYVEEVKMNRITLTAPIINQSNTIVFLVYGESKADAVKQVMSGERDIEKYPAQLIRPEKGTLHWFVDQKAALK